MKKTASSLTVAEPAGLAREDEPVRIGVPLARGLVKKCSEIGLYNGQDQVALQTSPLAYWPDGSLKWVLLNFFARCPPNGQNKYTLIVSQNGRVSQPAINKNMSIREEEHIFTVDTGGAKFVVPRDRLAPISSVVIDRTEILAANRSTVLLLDANRKEILPVIKTSSIEEQGSLRSTIVATGSFTDSSTKRLLHFTSRITFLAGMASVIFDLQIHNPNAAKHPGNIWDLGDPGSFLFKDLSLHLKAAEPINSVKWSTNPAEEYKATQNNDWMIYQDSSGGDNWNSTNHIGADGESTVSFQGFRIYSSSQVMEEGRRANPIVRCECDNFHLQGAVSEFWQNFPKAIRVKNNNLILSLFPGESAKPFELQGGEKKRQTIFLEFGKTGKGTHINHFLQPLEVSLDTEKVKISETLPFLIPNSIEESDYYAYVKSAIEGPHSFFNKREVIDEYGWRNFGDLYADHEAVNHKGQHPLVSHYNNQYDFIFGAMVQFISSGDWSWFELLQDAAHHMMDIDIYHTDNDKSAYNHGLFWHTAHYEDAATCTHRTYSRKHLVNKNPKYYGGGPSNEQNYTSGLLHYYYLTGDLEARTAVLELADWVIAMDDGSRTILSFLDKGPTGKASQTVSSDFHKPGRGAGNSINTLLDAYRLTSKKKYIIKAEELIQRCIHPKDNIAELTLDEPECRWSYLVFLQVLAKFLLFKEEIGVFDYVYFYARDSLTHYAAWMAENEKPYKELLHKVDIPTETWPAHDVRKSCIFYLASRYVTGITREKFIHKGQFYFQKCLDDLLSFETAYLARPMVILVVYGTMPLCFQEEDMGTRIKKHDFDFGEPVRFIPQKKRVMNRLDPRCWFKNGEW